MNEANLKTNRIRTVVNLLTAVCFLLFIAYHIYLAVAIESNRAGRMVGLISYFLLALAAIFALIPKTVFRIVRTVLMIAGLFMNFAVRLTNAGAVFGRLDLSKTPSVLNGAVYVFSQLAVLLLMAYYLVLRHNKKLNSKRKIVIALMAFVIVLYVACFVIECVLLMKYRVNIDLSRRFTVISRFFYCLSFVGMAVNFMLPVQEIEAPNDLMNQPPADELLFSAAGSSKKKSKKKNKNMRKVCRRTMNCCFQLPKAARKSRRKRIKI